MVTDVATPTNLGHVVSVITILGKDFGTATHAGADMVNR